MNCDSPDVQLNIIRVYFAALGHGLPSSSDVPTNRQDDLKSHASRACAVKSLLTMWLLKSIHLPLKHYD